MSNQGGLKHAATEPTRLENKRERRRGAAGRATVLRRAPSDSDCSGETASLSADSGDRAIRPAPQPPPRGKSRSRRRGSEWEVLEGLKDGQRFDKRPEVFNGYLHKKRKWPLKGWHKRFFVVDGGILVYARSPTDVARGRLHGSVDVGLSVISAKARRRRIDIDADEFIYHLRAKTPDVFRTWLNVLKAHRLFRQHLLTFGARESVPKIHAPLEDLPPTDTSSRTTRSTVEISSLSSDENLIENTNLPLTNIPSVTPINLSREVKSLYSNKNKFTLNDWPLLQSSSKLLPLKFDDLNDTIDSKPSAQSKSMKENIIKNFDEKLYPYSNRYDVFPLLTINNANTFKEKHDNNFEVFLKLPGLQSSLLCDYFINSPNVNETSSKIVNEQKNELLPLEMNVNNKTRKDKSAPSQRNKNEPIAIYCFSTHKMLPNVESYLMKRSKKSTNLVKYRNVSKEPPLKKPFNTYMLLRSYSNKVTDLTLDEKCNQSAFCNIVSQNNIEIQAEIDSNKTKDLHDSTTTSDLDGITEKLMMSIFDKMENDFDKRNVNIKGCINQVVKELYDSKTRNNDAHPVIALFKCLLEYWLKNTSLESVREAVKRVKSTSKQSNVHFTKDKNTSSLLIGKDDKYTQFHGMSDVISQNISKILVDIMKKKGKSNKSRAPRINNASYDRDRRIQELERVLKNTVYVCETVQSQNKERDKKITKTLIDNLDKMSQKTVPQKSDVISIEGNSNSSTELSKIQDTINQLLSETSLPLGVARDFLSAYLKVLDLLRDSKTSNTSFESTENSNTNSLPKCEFLSEAIQKNPLKSVTTKDNNEGDTVNHNTQDVDPKQLYLKNILDNVTSIFCKQNKDITDEGNIEKKCGDTTNTLGEINKKKSIILDLSHYSLEHVTVTANPDDKDITALTIKLEEKNENPNDSKERRLRLKFSDVDSKCVNNDYDWISLLRRNADSNNYFAERTISPKFNIPATFDICKEFNLKPYQTSSAASSKDNCIMNNKHFINLTFQKNDLLEPSNLTKSLDEKRDTQSNYILSSLKESLAKDKRNTQENYATANQESTGTVPIQIQNYSEEISMFENTPKTIDERFILMLLENLTLLSKNLPGIHKEINPIYARLRKRYEKVFKDDIDLNVQGVGLLEKNYIDKVNDKSAHDNETQFGSLLCFSPNKEIGIKTSDIITSLNATVPTDILKENIHTDAQTDICNCKRCLKDYIGEICCENDVEDVFNLNTINTLEIEEALKVEKAISNQNWYRRICTTDRGTSTIMKYVLQKTDSAKKMKIDKGLTTVKNLKTDKGHSNKPRQDLIQEITLLSPSFKAVSQSDTHKQRKRNFKTDFNVYELFTRKTFNLKTSSSMIVLNSDCKEMSDDLKTIYRCASYTSTSHCSGLVSPTGAVRTQAGFVSGTPGGRLASWIIESGGPLESASRELGQAQLSVQQLQRLLDALELQQQTHHDTDVSLEGASPNVKKDRRKFGLRKKKSNSKCASVELAPPHVDSSASHMALSALTAPPSPGGGASSMPNSAASLPIACAATRPQSLPGAEGLNAAGPTSLTSLTPDHQLREDFTVLAKDLVASLKTVVSTLVCERGRLRAAMDAAEAGAAPGTTVVAALRTNLTTALHQNSELRARLSRIHDASDLADISSVGRNSQGNRQFQQSLSYSSSCVSASEFFDAEEHDDDFKPAEIIDADQEETIEEELIIIEIVDMNEGGVIELDGDSSSEAGSLSSEEGSASSDNSDAASLAVASTEPSIQRAAPGGWTRRTELPAPRPTPGGPSLWNLLYKNIGKDLSQISMPVTINEPLNMLQRLCEELEYSELLDAAAACAAAAERAALVAAFAVSAYAAAAHRAASKPFNPLLAETYECVRADRGFRFLAEQVSHHPPISACHAESPRWCFWQEARIKTKFWGKSMEFQPAGRVHVRLLTTGDHYSWNKVTTCVHNLFGGQRWVDQYGDMHITCHGTDVSSKLNFIKASSWSSTRHEVRGAVVGAGTRLRLQGRWSEALHAGDPPAARCLWRPGAMPPEHEIYYGFTRFAMELNELEPGMKDVLPHTDTRLRPDQRALEEGDVDAAERLKLQLEQAQRERRRDQPDPAPVWFRKVTEGGEETWVFTGEYWRARDLGFPNNPAPRLW